MDPKSDANTNKGAGSLGQYQIILWKETERKDEQ